MKIVVTAYCIYRKKISNQQAAYRALRRCVHDFRPLNSFDVREVDVVFGGLILEEPTVGIRKRLESLL